MVFDLITSLEPVEKRYFKGRFKKDTQLLQLYNAILNVGSDKKEDLAPILAKEPYWKLINLLKKQLYEEILTSLRDFHKDNHIDFQIRNELTNVQILIYKKLFKHANKKINLLKKKIEKHESFVYMQDLLSIEMTLKQQFQKEAKYSETMKNINAAVKESLIGQELFQNKKSEYFELQNGLSNKKDTLVNYHFDISKLDNAVKFNSVHYFNTLSNITLYIEQQEYNKLIPYVSVLEDLLEKHPHELKQNVSQYIDVNYLCAFSCILNKKDTEARKFISVIEQLKPKGSYLPVKKTERLFHLNVLASLQENSIETVTDFYKQWENEKYTLTRIYFEKIAELLSICLINNTEFKLANRVNTDILVMSSEERDLVIYKRSLLREALLFAKKEDNDLFITKLESLKRRKNFWTNTELSKIKEISKKEDIVQLENWCNSVF